MPGVGIFGKHGIHWQARASHACMHACMPSDGGLGRQVFTLALHTASSWPTERASCMHAFPSTRRLTAPIFGMHAQHRWPRSRAVLGVRPATAVLEVMPLGSQGKARYGGP